MDLDVRQILTQIVAFLVMLWVLKRYCWKPLLGILDERKAVIQSEFDSIAAQKAEVERLAADYEEKLQNFDAEARVKMNEIIAEGRLISLEIQEDGQEKSKEMLQKAAQHVENELAKAKELLKKEIVEIVVGTTEKILQKKIDDPTHEKLIADFIDEVKFK